MRHSNTEQSHEMLPALTALADQNYSSYLKISDWFSLKILKEISRNEINRFLPAVTEHFQNKTLPIQEILSWTDRSSIFSLFDNQKMINYNKVELLSALIHKKMYLAIKKNLLSLDKVEMLAKSNIVETVNLLNILNSKNRAAASLTISPGYGLKFILDGSLSFDNVFKLVQKYGFKEVISFIKVLNCKTDPWFNKNLTPDQVFESALKQDGPLEELTDLLWRANDNTAIIELLSTNNYIPRFC